jgi:mono/diheme cytochrome c family protein
VKLPPSRRNRVRGLPTASIGLGVLLALALGACGFEPTPAPMRFAPNKTTLDELADQPAARAQIAAALGEMFGTPQEPRYPDLPRPVHDIATAPNPARPEQSFLMGGSGELSDPQLERIADDNRRCFSSALELVGEHEYGDVRARRSSPDLDRRLRELASRQDGDQDAVARQQKSHELLEHWYPSLRDSAELYRQECLHCHGVEGGGDGPTAQFLDPKPRDFRKGIFKFTALRDQARPRREDLLRTLDQGLPGSAMSNFRRFSLAERNGLSDYVRFLSIRGEVELRLVGDFKEDGELAPDAASKEFLDVWGKWQAAPEKLVVYDGDVPPPTKERIARGNVLFHDAMTANCASCHGDGGAGDGPASYKMGLDGKRVPAYPDAWGNPIVPRDLRQGVFRGGSRPIDIYRRIYAGINGGPMPALGAAKNAQEQPLIGAADLWCLVHYVRSLSDRPERPEAP